MSLTMTRNGRMPTALLSRSMRRPMLNEKDLRRTGFRSGVSIDLADGQSWVFPMPAERPELVDGGLAADPEFLDLLDAIREAEDRAEMLRAELALAIHLLDRNYDLGPRQLQRLFEFDREGPTQSEAQHAFHELAVQAFRGVRPAGGEHPVEWPWAGLLARLTSRFARERNRVSLPGARLDPPAAQTGVINR